MGCNTEHVCREEREKMECGPGLHEREVQSEGTGRIYLLHAPDVYDSATPRPLMVVLHGGGGSAEFAHRVHGWRDLSQREGCLVVFPEASAEDPARIAGIRENPRIWNDGSRRSAVARRNVDDIGYLASVLDDVQDNFAVDANRVFVSGFSNGASMTFRVGIELSDRIAAIAPVSGHLCLQELRPARSMSMLYLIGLADPLNPFDGGPTTSPWGARRQKPQVMESILNWVDLVGASHEPTSTHQRDGVKHVHFGPGETGHEVQLYTIEGQGHEWPGAERTLPRSISGPQTKKLNATQVIWDFFNSTRLPDPPLP
jgi:polyhydroxybutyrate depolymerase